MLRVERDCGRAREIQEGIGGGGEGADPEPQKLRWWTLSIEKITCIDSIYQFGESASKPTMRAI